MICQTVWLFDLNNTLHHADAGIFSIINRSMTAYLAEKLGVDEQTASEYGKTTGTATAQRLPVCSSTTPKSVSTTFCAAATLST